MLNKIIKDNLRRLILAKIEYIIKDLTNFLQYGSFDIFLRVNLENITACNRRCFYCPNSITDRGLIKNTKKMRTELFYKVIDELAKLKWHGYISPDFYGEPLIDQRLPELIQYTKTKLPESYICIYTNGDFLTIELYKKLVQAGVNSFIITQHPQGEPLKIKEIFDYRSKNGDDNVKLTYSKLEAIHNRGGVEIGAELNKMGCSDSIKSITIDCDGNLIFCCNDYFGTVKLGNLKNEHLIDIWKKPYYKKIRRDINKGVFNLEVCKKCKRGTIPTLGAWD